MPLREHYIKRLIEELGVFAAKASGLSRQGDPRAAEQERKAAEQCWACHWGATAWMRARELAVRLQNGVQP